MKVYRISTQLFAEELSGVGAALFGNRWNTKGTEMIYTAESRALAAFEVLVHLPLPTLPDNFKMIEIDIPDHVKIDGVFDLPDNWNNNINIKQTEKIGDKFILNNEYCLLKVPSAAVKGDYNYLINPFHEDFSSIRIRIIENFFFDERLFPEN
ncbi:MAG: RES family NAD+ phosphorylase [Ichthyobacteriaceae bacterium]|nr:RES family NAD+ phosphorylase [Ichthyobacteriaceae bacterium]